jgi:hypothetical protein
MEKLRLNEQRAKIAIISITIILVLEVVGIISGLMQLQLLQNVQLGLGISPEEVHSNDLREQIVASIYLVFTLISAITFICWFRRAYYNLHLKAETLSFSEGWASGSWFVPIINLYRPFQIMKELFRETHEILSKNGIEITSDPNPNRLSWWWTIWIFSNVLGQFVFRYSMKAETLNELFVVTISSVVLSLVGIPLGIITIKIIQDYGKQEILLREIEAENLVATNENVLENDLILDVLEE